MSYSVRFDKLHCLGIDFSFSDQYVVIYCIIICTIKQHFCHILTVIVHKVCRQSSEIKNNVFLDNNMHSIIRQYIKYLDIDDVIFIAFKRIILWIINYGHYYKWDVPIGLTSFWIYFFNFLSRRRFMFLSIGPTKDTQVVYEWFVCTNYKK